MAPAPTTPVPAGKSTPGSTDGRKLSERFWLSKQLPCTDLCANKVALTGKIVSTDQDNLKVPSFLMTMWKGASGQSFQLGEDPKTQREQVRLSAFQRATVG